MSIKNYYLFYVLLIFSTNNIINAKLEFINRDASINLKPTDSRLKFSSVNDVKGWKEESIILETGYNNSWLSDNIIYGDEIGDNDAPTHLLYNDSNAIVNLEDNITENSNAIASLDTQVSENSNAIFSASQSIVYLDQRVTENSNAIVTNQQNIYENSWTILSILESVQENSMAIVNNDDQITQNSNAIIYLKENINENSNAIVTNQQNIYENSWTILSILESVQENSMAIVNNDDQITQNSNAIIYVTTLAQANSSVILSSDVALAQQNSNAIINNSNFIAQELIIENSWAILNAKKEITENSNSIINMDTSSSELVKEPLITNITINRSSFIHPDQRIFVADNITIDGNGAVIYFAGKDKPVGPQFVVANGKTVTLKNIKFVGIVSDTVLLGNNQSGITIDENVSWELDENVTFTQGFLNVNGQNVWNIRGLGGQKLLRFIPAYFVNNPMINLGLSTLSLQNIELTGLEYFTYQQSGNVTGALGLTGNTAVNIEKSNDMIFYIESLDNTFRLLENNLTFNGLLNYADTGDNVLHFDFVLRSPIESFDAKEQLSKGKIPVVNFATNFIYLTSINGIARIIFDDAIVKVNNQSDAFIAIENSYLGTNKLQVSGDPIWDASSETAKNRFTIEAIELEAVGLTSSIIPEFGIPIIIDPGHHRSISNLRSIETKQDLLNILNKENRPQNIIQFKNNKRRK